MDLTPEQKALLKSLYNKNKSNLNGTDSHQSFVRHVNSEILLVDGYNTFFRCWCSDPSLDFNGNHVGGISGSLKSIAYAIRVLNPTRCIVIFDGAGGSFRRRKIYPNYKSTRKTKVRLNRAYEDHFISDNDEKEKCTKQLLKLYKYLSLLPVNILNINNVEADDTIAYCALDTFKNSNVKIMSTDKDFYQLINDRISVWSPIKKVIYSVGTIMSQYNIHPHNFILYRILDGDTSDNIDGIRGAGIKTILKCFPFLAEDKHYTVDDLLNYSHQHQKKYKLYNTIVENEEIVRRNYLLMQLNSSYLTTTVQLSVNENLDSEKIPPLKRIEFSKMLTEDGLLDNFNDIQLWITNNWAPLDKIIHG